MNKRVNVGLGLALVAACGVGYFLRARAIDRGWEQMLGELQVFEAAHAETTMERPVLYGESIGGDAYPHYLQAAKLAGFDSFDDLWAQWAEDDVVLQTPQFTADDYTEYSISEVFADAGPEAGEHRRAVLELGAGSLAALKAGAHAGRFGAPEPVFGEGAVEMEDMSQLTQAFQLGWMQAREHVAAGRDVACVQTVLDLVQTCCDLMGGSSLGPILIKHAWPAEYVGAWLDSGELAGLDEDALAVLEAGLLRALANVQPFSKAWPAAASAQAQAVQAQPGGDRSLFAHIGAMQRVGSGELYSIQLNAANEVRKSIVLVDTLRERLGGGLGSVGSAVASFEDRALEIGDDSVAAYLFGRSLALVDRARLQAKLRLLASAVAILRGAPERRASNLGDPYLVKHLTFLDTPERIVLSIDGHPTWRVEIVR